MTSEAMTQRAGWTAIEQLALVDALADASSLLPVSLRWAGVATQETAIRAVMQLVVEDDRAAGWSARQRLHCDACRRPRPAPGFLTYDGRRFCNRCATSFELAHLYGEAPSAWAFVWRPDQRVA